MGQTFTGQDGDNIALSHSDPDGPYRKREFASVGFLPTHPLKNDPDRSVYDTIPPPLRFDDRQWYAKGGV
jgi:hypothetical protein